jgi:hypothetical protein
MAIEVTINLDSGCLMPAGELKSKGRDCEVGYFQNLGDSPDIRVFVDGEERIYDPPLKLGNANSTIEVRHRNVDGTIKSDGVTSAPTFHKSILHMKDLYGEHIEMDRAKFDCVFRFETGRFMPSMVKGRAFKKSRCDGPGLFSEIGTRKEDLPPVSHNIVVQFTLKKGEVLEIAGKSLFLSSKDLRVKKRLEIEVPVDNSVGNKFYHDGFKHPREDDCYWLPNACDPPPSCPFPPCGDEDLDIG